MIAAWWLAVTVGAAEDVDPALRGVPGAEAVAVQRGAMWRVTVRGRTVEVAPALTPEAELAFRALVSSLLADLPLGSPDGPAERALALLEARTAPPRAAPERVPVVAVAVAQVVASAPSTPAPTMAPNWPPLPRLGGEGRGEGAQPSPSFNAPDHHPHPDPLPEGEGGRRGAIHEAPPRAATTQPRAPAAPTRTAPEPEPAPTELASAHRPPLPIAGWVGPELVVRDGITAGPGGAGGASFGAAYGGAVRVAYRPARATSYGASTRLTELAAEVSGFAAVARPLTLRGGFGVAGRRYALGTEAVSVHLVPQAIAGLAAGASIGGWRGELGLAAEIDLVPTRIGWSAAEDVLSPAALRVEIRLSPAGSRIAGDSFTSIEPERVPPTLTGTTEDEVTP